MKFAKAFCHSIKRANALTAGICSVIAVFIAPFDVRCLDHEFGSGQSRTNAESQITANCLGNMVAKMATQLRANTRAELEIQGDTANRHNAAPGHDLEGFRRMRKERAEGKRDSSGQRSGASNTGVTDPAGLQEWGNPSNPAGSSVGLGTGLREPEDIAYSDNKYKYFRALDENTKPEEP